MNRKLIVCLCIMAEIIFLIVAISPPTPESAKAAYLTMVQSQHPSPEHESALVAELARLNRYKEVFRGISILGFLITGAGLLRVMMRDPAGGTWRTPATTK